MLPLELNQPTRQPAQSNHLLHLKSQLVNMRRARMQEKKTNLFNIYFFFLFSTGFILKFQKSTLKYAKQQVLSCFNNYNIDTPYIRTPSTRKLARKKSVQASNHFIWIRSLSPSFLAAGFIHDGLTWCNWCSLATIRNKCNRRNTHTAVNVNNWN